MYIHVCMHVITVCSVRMHYQSTIFIHAYIDLLLLSISTCLGIGMSYLELILPHAYLYELQYAMLLSLLTYVRGKLLYACPYMYTIHTVYICKQPELQVSYSVCVCLVFHVALGQVIRSGIGLSSDCEQSLLHVCRDDPRKLTHLAKLAISRGHHFSR